MKFTCPHCGKRYASADDPAPGRVYSITCRCGQKIMVKGPESGAKVREPTPPPDSGPLERSNPFPVERRRVQIGAPPATGATPPEGRSPARPAPSPPTVARESRHPVALETPSPSPTKRPPVRAGREPLDPFADMPDLQDEARRAARPLDPFADMPDLQAEARGAARPLADVPEIRGPLPDPPPAAPATASGGYDAYAASQGLLIDEAEARVLAGAGPLLEPKVESLASPDGEAAVTFSEQLKPVAATPPKPKKASPRVALQPRAGPPAWFVPAAAVAAFVAIGGGAWLLLGRGRLQLPALPAILRGQTTTPTPPPSAQPAPPRPEPAPVRPEPARPEPAAPPAAPAVAPPAPPPAAPEVAAVPEPPKAHAAGPSRSQTSARRERSRRETASSRRLSRQAAAEARREAERRESQEPPRREEPPPKPAADRNVLDLLGKKQDAPPSARPPGRPTRGELTPAEVGAAIRASARAFDACVGEAARSEPGLQVVGRRVALYITVNPSGIVTGPRLDDAEVDDSVLGACFKATARKMVFPAYGGEPFQVRIPLVLGKGG